MQKSSVIRYHTKKSLTSNSISVPRFLQGVGSCTVQMLFFSRKGNEKIESQSNHLLITCDDSFKNSPYFAFPVRRYKWSCINWRGLCRQAKHPDLKNIMGWGRFNIWLVGYPSFLLLVIQGIEFRDSGPRWMTELNTFLELDNHDNGKGNTIGRRQNAAGTRVSIRGSIWGPSYK